ncbi:adenosylcobinamide-GDP ribazoletransferase [Virgibacillus oceani]
MKAYIYGLILNIQFFSIIPLQAEVPSVKKNYERAIQTFPISGLMQGVIYAGFLYMMLEWTPLSALAVAFLLWLLMIVLTGGIHLDAWIDCSDAFFSYRDKEKRLRIMEDSRVGAFGVLSVIVLLAARFFFLYEIILMANTSTYLFVLVIPFFGKTLMGMMLARVPLAKEEGMAYFFRKATQPKTLWIYPAYMLILFLGSALLAQDYFIHLLILLIMKYILFILFRRKSLKWFGGITGDVTGAAREGGEISLWIIVWLFHYYAMG